MDAAVTLYKNGPLILRGRFVLTAQDGHLIPAGRRTVALCRCGASTLKPFVTDHMLGSDSGPLATPKAAARQRSILTEVAARGSRWPQ